MQAETFKTIATETLKEVAKDEGTYGWTHWNPDKNWDSNTFISVLCVMLWEDSEETLVAQMCMPYDLTEDEARTFIREWLANNLPKRS